MHNTSDNHAGPSDIHVGTDLSCDENPQWLRPRFRPIHIDTEFSCDDNNSDENKHLDNLSPRTLSGYIFAVFYIIAGLTASSTIGAIIGLILGGEQGAFSGATMGFLAFQFMLTSNRFN